MKTFLANYSDRIHGVLSCFDRMLFRGYVPIMSGWQMAQFINLVNPLKKDLLRSMDYYWVTAQSERSIR